VKILELTATAISMGSYEEPRVAWYYCESKSRGGYLCDKKLLLNILWIAIIFAFSLVVGTIVAIIFDDYDLGALASVFTFIFILGTIPLVGFMVGDIKFRVFTQPKKRCTCESFKVNSKRAATQSSWTHNT